MTNDEKDLFNAILKSCIATFFFVTMLFVVLRPVEIQLNVTKQLNREVYPRMEKITEENNRLHNRILDEYFHKETGECSNAMKGR